MEHVIGWITTRPGRRNEFLARAEPFLAASRAEPGVLFFELLESRDQPDVAIVVEGYASAETHAAHVETPHFAQFWTVFQELVVHGRFENLMGGEIRTDIVEPS